MTAVFLDEFCSSVLGPTKSVVTQFYYSLLQSIRNGTVVTNYYYLNIVNYKKNKEINCLKSRSALFPENELLTQQQTTKCTGTAVVFKFENFLHFLRKILQA